MKRWLTKAEIDDISKVISREGFNFIMMMPLKSNYHKSFLTECVQNFKEHGFFLLCVGAGFIKTKTKYYKKCKLCLEPIDPGTYVYTRQLILYPRKNYV